MVVLPFRTAGMLFAINSIYYEDDVRPHFLLVYIHAVSLMRMTFLRASFGLDSSVRVRPRESGGWSRLLSSSPYYLSPRQGGGCSTITRDWTSRCSSWKRSGLALRNKMNYTQAAKPSYQFYLFMVYLLYIVT